MTIRIVKHMAVGAFVRGNDPGCLKESPAPFAEKDTPKVNQCEVAPWIRNHGMNEVISSFYRLSRRFARRK